MQYEAPTTVDQAVALLKHSGNASKILAGGTDLLVQLRSGVIEPELIVDIKKIAEVRSLLIGVAPVSQYLLLVFWMHFPNA
jgi:carbon-monoxide dehydrogenase medium subunit